MTSVAASPVRIPVFTHETLNVVGALVWRRGLLYRRNARSPGYLIAAVFAIAVVGLLISVIPRHQTSSGSLAAGVTFFGDLIVVPIFTALAFHIPATAEEAQWVLPAPGGPEAFLLERAATRLSMTCLWTASGLAFAAGAGHGRSPVSAVLLVLIAGLISLANTSMSSLAFMAASHLRKPRFVQLGASAFAAAFLIAMGFGIPGLAPVGRAAGHLVEGSPSESGFCVLILLTALSIGGFAIKMRSSAWFVEPMIASGLRQQRALADAGNVKAVTSSWDGARRLGGPAGAFIFVQLVYLRRFKVRILSIAAIIAASATGIAYTVPDRPELSFAPALLLMIAARLSPRASQPWRDEWFARSPSSLRSIILAAQTRQVVTVVLEAIASWIPAAPLWRHGALSYMITGAAGLSIMCLLSVSLNYASLVQTRDPTTSLFIRLGLPLVIASVGASLWFVGGSSSVLLASGLIVFCSVSVLAICELAVRAAEWA